MLNKHLLKNPGSRDLEDWRLSELVPDVDVSGHFRQDLGPEARLLRSGPAQGWRVPGSVLQLHATRGGAGGEDEPPLSSSVGSRGARTGSNVTARLQLRL